MTPEIFIQAIHMMITDATKWTSDNWLMISLVYFPAYMGYLNGVIAFLRVMGYGDLADWFGKFETACQAFVDEVRRQRKITKEEREEENKIAAKEDKKDV